MSQGLKIGGSYNVEAKNLAGQVVRVGPKSGVAYVPTPLPPSFQHAWEVDLVFRRQLLLLVYMSKIPFLAFFAQNIWKLTYFAKIWYPIEVAEVEIAASGGRWSGQGPDEKNLIKNLEIGNFWATKTIYTSKESWEQLSFRYETKSETFVLKKLKKSWFSDSRKL